MFEYLETDAGPDDLLRLANFIGLRNFVTFAEIQESLGLSFSQIIALKLSLEDHLRAQPGDNSKVSVTSVIHINSPGFFIEG